MKREPLLALLAEYYPTSPEEIIFKQQMLSFIKEQPHCFERTLLHGHITASAWLLNKNQTHALLMHHAKLNRWFQLGGHCDGEPDVLAVAIKEAQEESGIKNIQAISPAIFDIDIHTIPARRHEPEHAHYDIRFLLTVTSDEEIVNNHESKELQWINKNSPELPTNALSVTRMFHKWVVQDR